MKQRFHDFLERSFTPFRKLPKADVDAAWQHVVGRAGRESVTEPEGQQTDRPVNRWYWRAAAVAAAAVVLTVVLPLTVAAPAAVLEDGQRFRKISYGEVVRPIGEQSATLRLADGTVVEMRTMSEVSLEKANNAVRILLHRGDVIVDSAKQLSSPHVETKDMSAAGNLFLVSATEAGSRVAALEGETQVQRGTTEKRLAPGEQISTDPRLRVSRPEVAWSLRFLSRYREVQRSAAAIRETFETVSIRPHSAQRVAGQRGGGTPAISTGCSGMPPQVDPSRFSVSNATAFTLLTLAYGATIHGETSGCFDLAPLNLITGGPDWIKTERWDVQATIPAAAGLTQEQILSQMRSGEYPQLKKMLVSMLEDRFQLVVRRELKEIPAYVLTADPNASKVALPAGTPPVGMPATAQNMQMWQGLSAGDAGGEPGGVYAKESPVSAIIPLIAREATRPVIDRTGLTAPVSLWIQFKPTYNYISGRVTVISETSRFAGLPTLQKALEEIGLKLEDTKVSREVWVIEKIERPSEN